MIIGVLIFLNLAVTVLCLSALGHLHTKIDGRREQVTNAELLAESRFQHRCTRRMLREDFDTKILPKLGWKPEPSDAEKLDSLMSAMSRRGHDAGVMEEGQ